MEWLARWVRNLAFYFIFLSVLMNVIPQGEERKYIRFFMGLLLILVLIQPLLTVGQLEQILSWETLSEGIRQEYEDFSMEKKYLEQEGKGLCTEKLPERDGKTDKNTAGAAVLREYRSKGGVFSAGGTGCERDTVV